MKRSLLLVGHGSSLNSESSAPVYAHATRISALNDCDVRVAFWKEAPRLCDAWCTPRSEEVFVVPMFLAEGYYTREVVPRELGLAGPVTRRGTRVIRYCAPVGAHPRMSSLVLCRALQTARLSREERRRAALVVIGHGTERNATSSATVRRITRSLRRVCDFASVACGFLDQAPRIERVVAAVDAAHIVLVPFLLADGWHTRETIPDVLGLDGVRTERAGRVLWYTRPVGTMPEVAGIVLAQARAAGMAGMKVRPDVDGRRHGKLDISLVDMYRKRHDRADEWHDDD
jgi:sirohydrochlorin cobaltochelatase